MRNRLVALGGWLVAAALLLVVLVLVLTGGHKAADTAAPSPTTSPLTGTAKDLVDRLAVGRQVTFHARYRVQSPAVTAGGSLVLELWHKGQQLRQDTTVTSASQPSKQVAAFFRDGTAVTSCARTATGPWTCSAAAAGQVDGPDALIAQLTGQLSGVTVTGSRATVAGIASDCYDLQVGTDSSRICLRADGVPTLIASGPARLELTTVESTVPTTLFTPPAAAS